MILQRYNATLNFGFVTIILCLSLSTSSEAALIHQYLFENNVVDSAGNAHGSLGNNIYFSNTVLPNGFASTAQGSASFTRPDDAIIINHEDFANFGSSSFSIAFWAKFNNTTETNGIVDKLDLAGTNGFQLLKIEDKLRLRLDDDLGNDIFIDSTASVIANQWTHFAISIDRNGERDASWFIDGTIDTQVDISTLRGDIVSNQDLWLLGANSEGINGALAQLQFYNHALTSPEVNYLVSPDSGTPVVIPSTFLLFCLGFASLVRLHSSNRRILLALKLA